MTRYLGFGHSHIVAVAKGAYALQAKEQANAGTPAEASFHYLYDAPFHPAWLEAEQRETAGRLNGAILDKLLSAAPQFVVLSVGGNEHNVLSFSAQDRPYDFILSEEPDAPLCANAEIIPESAIRETLHGWMKDKIAILDALSRASAAPCMLISPPPPLPRAHVLAHPGELVRLGVDSLQIAPEHLRAKMWHLQTRIYEKICADINVAFIPVPPEFIDENGMLTAEACGNDATHANEIFGEAVMQHALRAAETLSK